MTTTELIELLKKHERGGATGKPREITLNVNGVFMAEPEFEVDSTDDGLYTGICLSIKESENDEHHLDAWREQDDDER